MVMAKGAESGLSAERVRDACLAWAERERLAGAVCSPLQRAVDTVCAHATVVPYEYVD